MVVLLWGPRTQAQHCNLMVFSKAKGMGKKGKVARAKCWHGLVEAMGLRVGYAEMPGKLWKGTGGKWKKENDGVQRKWTKKEGRKEDQRL